MSSAQERSLSKDLGQSPNHHHENWLRASEDPIGGGIPREAALGEAENADHLGFWANPGYEEPPLPSELKEALEREPVAAPRHIGPEHVTKQLHKSYKTLTDQPVRYPPVRLSDQLIGYLWASVTNDAAYFVRRVKAQPESNFAEGWWLREFVNLHKQGLSPLEAIRARVGTQEDPKGGRIDAGDEERTASSIEELKEIARQ